MSLKKILFSVLGLIVLLIAGLAAYILYTFNMPLWGSLVGRAELTPEGVARLSVPPGFSVGIYATGIENARMMHATRRGDILVSSPRDGMVYLIEGDIDGDGQADGIQTLLSGIYRPHGLDIHDGWLYVAETNAIGRIRFDEMRRELSGEYERIVERLPNDGGHWTRTIKFGPDGKMYLTIGSSCNVCIEEDDRRATIMRFNKDGSGGEIYASGLRNSVGFDWSPENNKLYATDNGRDRLGDDYPADELNLIVEGGFYGWPVANGMREADPQFGEGAGERIGQSIPPVFEFDAHVAPLGIAFVRSEHVPVEYRGAALVAFHGSWNRSEKSGYKVVSLHWGPDGQITAKDFMWGFEVDEDVIGRPVDIIEGIQGEFYVSDDYTGTIYKIVFDGLVQPSFADAQINSIAGL